MKPAGGPHVPPLWRWLITRLLHPTDRPYALADLDEDFQRQLEQAGVGPARRWYRNQVLRSLLPCSRQRLRYAWGLPKRITVPWTSGRPHLIRDLGSDLRLALRAARKRPAFTAIALFTIALGIGATTAVFSVVDGVLLHPLPHPDADQLVVVWETDGRLNPPATRVNVSPANYADWRSQNRVFEDLAPYSIGQATLTGLGEPEMVRRAWVGVGLHRLLRATPLHGRLFAPGEDSYSADNVVLLSYAFWSRKYGSDPTVVGTTMTLNGDPYTIAGVLEPGVDFLARDIQVWTPFRMAPSNLQDRDSHSLNVLARMKPGVTLEIAQRELDVIADRIRVEHPESMSGYGVNVVSLREELVGRVRPALTVVLAGVLIVLLITTVNVTNLLLVRATERRREHAVRTALGAGPGRLIRQSLTESLTLSIVGGTLGLALASAATPALLALGPSSIPRIDEVGMDARVAAFAFGVSLLNALALGFLPALRTTQTRLGDVLHNSSRSVSGGGQTSVRRTLVIAEVALSMVLLIGAGLLTRAFWRLNSIDPGFSSERILTAKVRLPASAYPEVGSMTAFYDELLRDVRSLPQVSSAALTRFLPLSDGPWTFSVQVAGQPEPLVGERRSYDYNPVSSDYFRTAGVKLLEGRAFTPADNADAAPVVIVNETFRRRYWADQAAIGRRIRFDMDGDTAAWRTVVGVAADVRHDALHMDPRPTIYGPQAQAFAVISNRMRLLVRTFGDPVELARSVRETVHRIDPNLPVFDIRTMDQIVASSVAQPRFSMLLIGGFAVVASLLAMVGVFGVVSYSARQRLPELGLRIALGANSSNVVRLVLQEGLVLTLCGVTIGVLCALLAHRLLDSLLFGVSSTDPLTYVGLALSLLVAVTAACLVPAVKATAVDPTTVMRSD